ncbi:ankyrin repeat-containing domain protein [Cladorrhinum sp. PSN332]|nr:ankyrin repeat-containing domain protein [Cladorrhinum sp. PSN332]
MDPITALGVTSGIIACIQLSGSVIKQLGPSSNSRDDLNKILKTLCGFKGAFDGVKTLIEANNDDQDRLSTLQHIEEPLKACQESLDLIQERLKQTSFLGKYVVGKVWDGRLRKALKSLDDAKDLLELCMCADQGVILSAVQEYVRSIASDVQDLKGVLNENGKRMTDMTCEVQNMASQLRRNHNSVDAALNNLSWSVSQTQTEPAAKRRHLETEKSLVTLSHDLKDNQKRSELLKWLFNTDPNINHNAACVRRGKGTGSWLLNNEQFLKWRDESEVSLIWLSGMPGCGKSFLSSAIVDHLQGHYSSLSTKFIVAFYYFSFSDPAKQLVRNFVSSILLQVVQRHPSIPASLRSLHDEYQPGQPPLARLLQCLEALIASSGRVFVILDALDECPTQDGERDLLLSTLGQIHSWKLPRLRLLLTSRLVDDISHYLTNRLLTQPLHIDNEVVSTDIRSFVRAELSALFLAREWPSDLENEVEEVLVRGANGVFRWVSCQLDLIKTSRWPSDVRRELKLLPKTLDETYERALLSIEHSSQGEAAIGLAWLVCASRAIRVEEFVEAVALDEYGVPDPKRLERSEALLKALESLASTVSRMVMQRLFDFTGWGGKKEVPHEIKLAHFSVQEYLTSERIGQGPAQSFRIERGKAHALIAEMCLKYLLRFKKQDTISPGTLPKYPLFQYAASSWHVHMQEAAEECKQDLAKLAVTFLRSPALSHWLRIYKSRLCGTYLPTWQLWDFDYGEGDDQDELETSAPLFYASTLGLVEMARMLLVEDKAQINSPLYNIRSCLPIAAYNGFDAVVKLLIDHGADLRNRTSMGDTALHMAAKNGRASTIQLLLSSGAKTGSKGQEGFTALHCAANYGFSEICDTLIKHGPSAILDQRSDSGKTALHNACQSHHVAVVSCLLDHGADISAEDIKGQRPLHAAFLHLSRMFKDGFIDLLVARGANYDLPSGLGWTPFMLAVRNNDPEGIKQLLKYGRLTLFPENRFVGRSHDKELFRWPETLVGIAKNIVSEEILYPWFRKDHDEVVRLLLEAGYGRQDDYEALLLLGAERSWISTCEYLLEVVKANPFHQNREDKNALHLAIENYSDFGNCLRNHEAAHEQQGPLCRALLRAGGGTLAHVPDKDGNVPFQMALDLKWVGALAPMIQHGADYQQFGPPLRDHSFSWAHWAVCISNNDADGSALPICRVLAERGERFDLPAADGMAPVHYLFGCDIYSIPEAGTIADKFFGTGITGDIRADKILETLQVLVEVGADITAATIPNKETILHMLAKFNSDSIKHENKVLEIVRFAVEHGVDIMARDKDGRTAIDISEDQFKPGFYYSPQVLKVLETVVSELGVQVG